MKGWQVSSRPDAEAKAWAQVAQLPGLKLSRPDR